MRAWLSDHVSLILHIAIGVVTVMLIVVLVLGISSSNLTAAMIAGAGLAIAIVVGGSMLLTPDNERSRATERMLRLASVTFVNMRDGLNPESCSVVCQVLLPETHAAAIAISDEKRTLAYVGEKISLFGSGTLNSAATREVLKSKRTQTFTGLDKVEWEEVRDLTSATAYSPRISSFPFGIIVPLIVSDRAVGTLKLFYRRGSDVDRTQVAIARGLGELLSSQLTSAELDRQEELTARAEVKALQAQINPHFLFNVLNTIAALTRTNPAKARELLREFSVFYRRTLESSQAPIPLSSELEQTRRYLYIEKARFGEDSIIESERVEEGCGDVMVPGFLVQPIVENAVRHAMSDEGPLHIDVQVAIDGNDLLIAVADDGLGMDEATAEMLLAGSSQDSSSAQKGTGIALCNVAERVEFFFGVGSGVEILSRPGEGTCVTLRLVNAAPGAQRESA